GQGNKNPVTLVNGVPTPTVAPGTNGCQYLNPFPSAFAKNTATGQTNPGFVGTGTYQGYTPGMGLQNDPALVKWLYSEQETNYPGQFDVIDLLLRGDLDYHLWAKDPIQVAIGAQYRERHTVTDINNIGDARINPCATPGYGALPGFGGDVGDPTCQNRNGPVLYRRNFNISGTSQDYDRRYPVESAFGEVKVPVTSKLNTQASVRWEKYFSDLGAQDNAVVVTGWGARYQLTDDVAFRATAQQSFSQANPLGPAPPVVSVSTVPTSFGGSTGVTYESWNVPNTEVKPERGLNYNVGGIFQIGNDVTATLDYYNISIGSVIDPGGLSATTVINAVAVQGQTGPSTLINCDSELITRQQSALGGHAFVELAPGFTCVQGQTTMLAALSAKGPNNEPTVVRFFGAQGQERRTFNGGSLDTSGVDANVRWRLPNPVWGGDLSITGDLSYILTYEVGSFKIAGIPYSVAYDGIGYVNNGSQRPGGQRIYPWRGSLTFNFHKGRHNFNWNTRFVSSITNNDVNLINGSTSALPGSLNANIGDVGGNYVSAACTTDMVNYPPIPDAAGTGIYGARGFIGGTAGNQVAYGYNPCQNGGVRIGDKLRAQSTSSLTWRVQLPKDVDFTLTVDNVFDQQPAFSRDGLNYDSSSSVSPLGRTYQVSVRKTF
ncbi:MAG TPA: TonB-dependent receptor, partial [Caulobacteraceae bacterium]|nr:TonB-dependent receptor [Caulobacteraceae bacterium]